MELTNQALKFQGEIRMSDFYDAFQELKGLEDATFSFDKPGILKLNTFLNTDDKGDDTLIVVDPEAESDDDVKTDTYNGEVILKCGVCGGLITKAPDKVVVDEEKKLANVEEECPYCYNIGGYEIVGEIKVPETLEYEEVDEFGDRTPDNDEHPEYGEEVVEFDESLKEFGDAFTESYELLNGTVVKCFSDHDKAENYANSKGYKLAEYGNLGGDFAYAYWNETGDRNDDELVIAYYAFGDDGKARPLTEREKRYIAKKQVVEFDESLNEAKNPNYDEQSAKHEEPSLQFTNEDLSKDDVNIIGRKEATKRFNKGEEIYVGLKGNRDLWGFVKDDETPTFKDVEDYVTDDGAVKVSDIVYAVANTAKKVEESRNVKKHLKEEVSDAAFRIADYIANKFEDKAVVSRDEFENAFDRAKRVFLKGEEGDDDLETDVRIILDMCGFETEIEGDNEGGLSRFREACEKVKKHLKEGGRGWRSNIIEFPNGEYVYIAVEDGKLIAGGATNTGIIHDYEMDIDGEEPTDAELQDMYDMIVDKHPEYLEESCKKRVKKTIKESAKLISTLYDYTPWSGAVNTYDLIRDEDKIDELDSYLEDFYPDGLTMTELNDLLWFDGDSVLHAIGIVSDTEIDDVIDDVIDDAERETFSDEDELISFIEENIEEKLDYVERAVVEVSDGVVTVTVKNTEKEFDLTDFTIESEDDGDGVEESLTEAKKEVEDFYDVVYDTITGQKKIKGTSNPIRGCMNPDNMGVDKETGNMMAKCRTEQEADKVEKYVKDMFGDEGVTTARKTDKYDKAFPFKVVIDVPEERIIPDVEDKVVTKEESLKESVEGVTVTTDTDVVNVDVKNSDGITVDVKGKEPAGDAEAVVEPVSDETKEEIIANGEENTEGEMLSDQFDEFDEEEFDELGESYLKEVYDNVKSFKTTRGIMDKDRIKLEGIIEFNSGKRAKTSFVFERYMTTPRGKFKLLGENLQLTSRKNAFILTGNINGRKLCMESLTYKYTAKDAKGGKSKQVYGTKRVSK